ncbi:uncharacterized protein LOC114942303 [Nylanderia fulva]|uniref:uncharacterized protein LOC114942303 n=1 Tax=Nylanderia fulva TaxID=613905 RepID=UPI0010FB2B3B|nr:uncharacterized protein LOC114942303 [Nylanderia fulva]
MPKTISTLQTPFQNLKFIAMLYRIMGLLSCKLIKGRLKPSACGRYYCASWILIHCAYSGVFYYDMYVLSLKEESESKIIFFLILRFTAFIASLIPYNWVATFQDQDLVMFSNKLETYDDRARALGHERKDNHIFIWLFFVLTSGNLARKIYYAIWSKVADGTIEIIKIIFEEVVPFTVGTYCIYITGIFLDLIRQRFRHLNETIIPFVSQSPVIKSSGEITIYDVRCLHCVLIDSANLINKLYGIGSFLTSFSILIDFVAYTYGFATNGKDENEVVAMLDLLFQAFYMYTMYHFVTYENVLLHLNC